MIVWSGSRLWIYFYFLFFRFSFSFLGSESGSEARAWREGRRVLFFFLFSSKCGKGKTGTVSLCFFPLFFSLLRSLLLSFF
ncbi:hypothetical protein P170DRAFT_50933 [Aspergillus steynii IBT 23096]|uniref:Uncharacterized protein n=1 Tax=Aspergillus steynii IBT 23096 TaxID=1392250 RepID=A0A2I2GSJ2_9EURO|nr:uncharacterized protein P170DRAFT_50933 [Aspergillus steynii IBT 23096]PLB55849.1 hypothetical protein P170DRAFT_50933 [Aspergillus steynii IBT 23096]